MKIGGAGGIRTHEWRFCRAYFPPWPISFQLVSNVLMAFIWDVWACQGLNVQSIVQTIEGKAIRLSVRREPTGARCPENLCSWATLTGGFHSAESGIFGRPENR